MSNGMFLDTDEGMGIWTKHVTKDGKVYYYNMKRNESRWESEFLEKGHSQSDQSNSLKAAILQLQKKKDVGDRKDTQTKTIEQIALEAALKEREMRLEEVRKAKAKKQQVDPSVLAYKKQVQEYTV